MSPWIGMLAFARGANRPEFIADTSALSRFGHHPAVREALLPLISQGQLGWADPTRLEMGLTATNLSDHTSLGQALDLLPRVQVNAEDFDRAWAVQGTLAGKSRHRGVALPDLLVAACAERLELTVIHCDSDFDLIGQVTGQPMRWAVDRSLL